MRPDRLVAGSARHGSGAFRCALLALAAAPSLALAAVDGGVAPAAAADGGAAPVDAGAAAGARAADGEAIACLACHDDLVGRKVEHGPVKDDCKTCHAPSGKAGKCRSPVASGWKLAHDQPALCLDCHDVRGKTPLHAPITSGGCTACHDPHGSANPSLLTKSPIKDLCVDCHPPLDDAHVHTAVKEGNCLGCHDPHSGEAEPLLVAPKEKLCGSCHKADAIAHERVKHAPVVEGRCLDCHDAHGSANPKQTIETGKALCLKCHDVKAPTGRGTPGPAARVDAHAKDAHRALRDGDCQDCHVAGHSSKYPKLLAAAPAELCWKCHSRNDDFPFVHGAVRLGDCSVCHDPHGARPGLLRAEGKELCFRCHSDDVTGRAFVHKPVAEGRCTDCHDPHGADAPANLKNGEGKAACLPCHKEKGAEVKFKHEPLDRLGCTACHDPHGTANRDQLLKPTNALCQSCHTDKTNGLHVTTFVQGGHAISGGSDPHDPSREFSCASCHDPHGSNSPKLLRSGASAFESCDYCHGDKTGKHPELKDLIRNRRRGPQGGERGATR